MPYAKARLTLFAVMLVSLIGTAGIALPYPIIAPLFLEGTPSPLTHYLGLEPKVLMGIILALYPLGLLIGSAFIGALSDFFGRRRMLVLTLLISVVGYGLTAYAVVTESFPLFAAARLLTGICEGNISIARAIALDLHPVIDRTRSLSLVFASNYAGWMIGPLMGGYLMLLGAEVSFYGAGLIVLVCTLLVALFIRETGTSRTGNDGSHKSIKFWQAVTRENSVSLLKLQEIRPPMLYHFLFTLGLNAFYEFYPLWLVEAFGYDSTDIAWVTVATTATMIATSAWLITRLNNRFGEQKLLIWGTALLAALLSLLPLSSEWLMYLLFAAVGMVVASTNGVFPAYMAKLFDHHGQGRIMGLLATSFCFANVVVALGGSWLSLWGASYPLLLGGVLCAGSVLWLICHFPKPDPPIHDSTIGEVI